MARDNFLRNALIYPLIYSLLLLIFYYYLERANPDSQEKREDFSDLLDQIDIDCSKILGRDSAAIQQAKHFSFNVCSLEEIILQQTNRCKAIRDLFGFDHKPSSAEEREFPLAYGLVVHTNVVQVLFMLSSFYRPHNEYCIAVSGGASAVFRELIHELDHCFPNVRVLDRPPIKWGSPQILRSLCACLEVLSSSKSPWKYYQHLSGVDIPLKTNKEMVAILKRLNGTAIVKYLPMIKNRLREKCVRGLHLRLYASSLSAIIPRAAIDKIVESEETKRLLAFLEDTQIPDEHFWGTLTGNTEKLPTPGGIEARKYIDYRRHYRMTNMGNIKKFLKTTPRMTSDISRYQIWKNCKGKYTHGSCVYGVEDLALTMKQPHFIAHKMYIDYQPAAFFCALKIIRSRERQPIMLDLTQYSEIPLVELKAGVPLENLTHPLWMF